MPDDTRFFLRETAGLYFLKLFRGSRVIRARLWHWSWTSGRWILRLNAFKVCLNCKAAVRHRIYPRPGRLCPATNRIKNARTSPSRHFWLEHTCQCSAQFRLN